MRSNTPLQDGLIELMKTRGPFDLFLTFNVHTRPIRLTIEEMRTAFIEWAGRVDRKLLGRNWHRNKNRTYAIGVFENRDRNLHLHVLYRFPTSVRLNATQRVLLMHNTWSKLIEGGQLHIQQITALDGLAHYLAKQQYKQALYNQFVVLGGAMPAT
jgi:uncharacterized NAD(P)/FAD-binding protein YdhS